MMEMHKKLNVLKCATVVQQLKAAAKTGNGVTFIYSEQDENRVSYQSLYCRCLKLAEFLIEKGIAPNDKVIVDCVKIETQVHLFWACALVGCVPVLIAHKESGISPVLFEKLGECWVITDCESSELPVSGKLVNLYDYDLTVEASEVTEENYIQCATAFDDPCCMLLSSGTTSSFKIVPLTGSNIFANVRGEQIMAELDVNSRILAWMPFHHSGGLVIHHLSAIFTGCDLYVIPTEVYSHDPILWLHCLSKYRITFSGTISYAMRNLLRRFDASEKFQFDLSNLHMVSVGAESVSMQLCYDFEKTFEPYGLKKNAVVPTYGLTETSCLVGWGLNSGMFECYRPADGHMGVGERVTSASSNDTDAYLVYSMSEGVQTKILDSDNSPLDDYHIGNIWLRGNMIVDHYYTDMDLHGHLFKNGWFFTGDIGFRTAEGKVAIVGRVRDLLKICGEFYSSQVIENIAKTVSNQWVEDVFVAEYKDDGGIDNVGVFVVCSKWMKQPEFLGEFYKYSNKLRKNITDKIGYIPCEILPIPYVPETDTKKIKRFELKNLVDTKLQRQIKEITVNKTMRGEDIDKELALIIEEAIKIKISDYNCVFSNYGIVSKDVPLIVEQINKKFKIDINVAAMFNFPTVYSLADHILENVTNNKNFAIGVLPEESNISDDDIAIVGMSNRFPGGSNSPEQFWEFLKSGVDGIADIPKNRWDGEKYYSENDDEAGKMYCKKGGFINAPIDEMDANFFNISPREAATIDPHQRLLLELTWEAFENGGMDITKYSGTKTGVFLGLSSDEYGLSSINSGDLTKINTYSLTGICYSTACGRISYTYGFQGPCFSVDTACSSFLTALHLATVSIKNHDADCAVVGGASLMLTPVIGIAFSKLKAVCHDGHCKTFDDSADGYGRGEGAGVIILKRLSDAECDHDNILGVIRATGINQDGRSNGLTAPNGESQCMVIQDTLRRSGLKNSDIDYVEAHGTGTPLGDPIEVNAIWEGYCKNANRQLPLYIGSVKSNIGHLEAASGVASIIKVLLSMQHEMIPGNLGFYVPSTKINWSDDIRVVASNTPWIKGDRIRRASINSFGFGGSNAHVIIEEYKKKEVEQKDSSAPYVLKISAKNNDALRSIAMKYAACISELDETQLHDFVRTANIGRADLQYRIAVTGETKQHLEKALNAYVLGKKAIGLYTNESGDRERKIAFMFTGQSSQYVNMAKTLYANNKIFRESFTQCDDLFKPYIMCSLVDLVYGENASADIIQKTVYAQPLIFVVEYALAQFWASVGIRPSLVLGHSIGEYAAAVIAGIMDLETAVMLVALRGRLMNEAPGKGTMVTIFADRENTQRLIGKYADTVSIAVHNSQELCVISGVEENVFAIAERASQKGIQTKRLNVSHAFHSAMMRPAADWFYSLTKNNVYSNAKLTFMSTMYGRALKDNEVLDASYWSEHICNEVKFVETITAIEHYEDYVFLEIGATNTLTSLCKYIFGNHCQYTNSLDVKNSDMAVLSNAVAKLYVLGCIPDWTNFIIEPQSDWLRVPNLPTYPFTRSRYWNEMYYDRGMSNQVQDETCDSLLGQRIESPVMNDTVIFQTVYTPETPYFMSEHIIFDTAIAPAAAYMALIISAMKNICNPTSISIKDIEFREPLSVTDRRKVQVCISGISAGEASYQILSCNMGEANLEWIIHTQGKVVIHNGHLNPPVKGQVEEWQSLEFDKNGTDEHAVYPAMTDAGFKLGKGFRRLMKSCRNETEGIFFIEPDKSLTVKENYVIYPGVIDSVFHTMLCMVLESALLTLGRKETETMIPYFIGEFSYDYQAFDDLWVNTQAHIENDSIVGDSYVFNTQNQPVITIGNMITKLTSQKNLLGSRGAAHEREYYHYAWEKTEKSVAHQADYASVCFVCDDASELAELEKHAPLPVRRVIYKNAEEVLAATENLPKPVLYLYGCGYNETQDVYEPMKALFDLIGAVDNFTPERESYLRIVTKNAVAFENNNINLAQSVLWGFVKSFIMECPDNYRGIVDISDNVNVSDAIDELLFGSLSELCVRGNNVYASYLQRHADYLHSVNNKTTSITFNPDVTYVIAGGTGSVGQAYIGMMANAGAKHFAIMSRHESKKEFVKKMQGLDVDARCFTCNVADADSVKAAIATIKEEMPQIKGVMNISGVFRDKMLSDMSWDDFAYVMEPKVKGSMNLYNATQDLPLDFFHMTSSITAILGNMGQTNYGAANFFMNCLAEKIAANGIAGSVICWGPWDGSDVVSTQAVSQNMESIGLHPYTVSDGQQILAAFFERYVGSVMAVSVDWNKFEPNAGSTVVRQMLKRIVNHGNSVQEQQKKEDFLSLVKGTSKKETRYLLTENIKKICRDVMGYDDTDSIDDNVSFRELGADSLMIFSMRSTLNEMLQSNINVSDFYNYTTIRKFVDHIIDDIIVIEEDSIDEQEDIDLLAEELSSLLED